MAGDAVAAVIIYQARFARAAQGVACGAAARIHIVLPGSSGMTFRAISMAGSAVQITHHVTGQAHAGVSARQGRGCGRS